LCQSLFKTIDAVLQLICPPLLITKLAVDFTNTVLRRQLRAVGFDRLNGFRWFRWFRLNGFRLNGFRWFCLPNRLAAKAKDFNFLITHMFLPLVVGLASSNGL
jgi:hypothetical protein